MDIKKLSEDIFHDKEAMWQLGVHVYIELESLQRDILETEKKEYLIRDGKLFDCNTSRYKKELNDMKVQLEFVRKIIMLSEKSHKYLVD